MRGAKEAPTVEQRCVALRSSGAGKVRSGDALSINAPIPTSMRRGAQVRAQQYGAAAKEVLCLIAAPF